MINSKINTIFIISMLMLVFSNCSTNAKTDKTKDAALALLITAPESKTTWKEVISKDGKVKIPYKIVGNSSGKKILVVHGGPGLSANYNEKSITDALGANYQLVFYDQRFTGNSSSTLTSKEIQDQKLVSMSKFVDDLETVRVAAFGKDTQVNFLGHSWGGRLVAEYNISKSLNSKVKSVIFASSIPFHWTAENIKTANIAKKAQDYNLTDGVGNYNKIYTKFGAALGQKTLKDKAKGLTDTYTEYFQYFFHNKSSMKKVDFTFNEKTAQNHVAVFSGIPLFKNYNYEGKSITGLKSGSLDGENGINIDLANFPDNIPVLIMHGKSDPFDYRYATAKDNASTNDILNIATFGTGSGNTFKDVRNVTVIGDGAGQANQTGAKMFGESGVSIYQKLVSGGLPSNKITIKELEEVGHFPSAESPDEYKRSIINFLN